MLIKNKQYRQHTIVIIIIIIWALVKVLPYHFHFCRNRRSRFGRFYLKHFIFILFHRVILPFEHKKPNDSHVQRQRLCIFLFSSPVPFICIWRIYLENSFFSSVGLAALVVINPAVSWYSLQQAAKIWPQVTFMQIYDSFSNGFHPPTKNRVNQTGDNICLDKAVTTKKPTTTKKIGSQQGQLHSVVWIFENCCVECFSMVVCHFQKDV